jgi:hypothetical protein
MLGTPCLGILQLGHASKVSSIAFTSAWVGLPPNIGNAWLHSLVGPTRFSNTDSLCSILGKITRGEWRASFQPVARAL